MFYINSLHNSTEKRLNDFFCRYVTAFHEKPLTPPPTPPCFPSRDITKNAETHPTPMVSSIVSHPPPL